MHVNITRPSAFAAIDAETKASGFTMASDELTGSLLRTLAGSKPRGKFLELGTGTGLSASWILGGMDDGSTLISVDNDEKFISIARRHLGHDPRATFACVDGEIWLRQHAGSSFDYIFADTWYGKYLMLDETLAMLAPGGFYIIDDMLPQPNWPEGHDEKSRKLQAHLYSRTELALTSFEWSTGIVVAVRKPD